MRKIKIASLLACLAVLGTLSVAAQGLQDIRINEILVVNQNSYTDDHSEHSSWIELHNSGYSNVNIGGAYLSVKLGDETRTYRIPKNDARTLIAPQGYVLFYANGSSNRGTFHTNFKLDETGYVAFLDQGRNVIDEVTYEVAAQRPDVSIGWLTDPETKQSSFGPLPSITPMQGNETEVGIDPSEKFRMRDPSGIVMALTAMSAVFSALILLYLFFKPIGKLMVRSSLRKEQAAVAQMPPEAQAAARPDQEIIGEEIAAIALALRRYEEDMHDIESHVLTINRIAKAYSPWSSKIYGLNNQLPAPVRKR